MARTKFVGRQPHAVEAWAPRLQRALERSGDGSSGDNTFACGGTLSGGCTALEVQRLGAVSFPLSPADWERLRDCASPAPYGKNTQTLVNTNVRNALQVDAARVSLQFATPGALERVCAQASQALWGVQRELLCTPYKLLLYETGGHFCAHRDTEKEPGHVATLSLSLPAGPFTGGSLVVRSRKSGEKSFDFSEDWSWAAFYADAEHEVLPVSSGRRLVLVYSLCLPLHPPPLLKHPFCAAALPELQAVAADWASQSEGRDYVLIRLERMYTERNLSFSRLKGSDAAAAAALLACGLYDMRIVLLKRTVTGQVSGEPDERDPYRDYEDEEEEEEHEEEEEEEAAGPATPAELSKRKRGGYSGEYGEMFDVEVAEEEVVLCVAPDGRDCGGVTHLDDTDGDVLDAECPLFCEDDEPDEEEFSGYTGNEGASVDLFYSRAAFVLWPRARALEVAKQLGVGMALSLLARAGPAEADSLLDLLMSRGFDYDGWEEEVLDVLRSHWQGGGSKHTLAPLVSNMLRGRRFAAVPLVHAALLQFPQNRAPLIDAVAALAPKHGMGCIQLASAFRALDAELASALVAVSLPALIDDSDRFTSAALGYDDAPAELGSLLAALSADSSDGAVSWLNRFCAAAVASAESPALCVALLKDPAVAAAASRGMMAPVVRVRCAQLEGLTASPPVYSERRPAQPNAILRADVHAFLQGPAVSATFRGFKSLPEARRFCSDVERHRDASVSAVADGRGADATAKLTKTRAAFQAKLDAHNKLLAELHRLRSWLPAGSPAEIEIIDLT